MKILIGLILILNFAFVQKENLETVYAVESDLSDYSHVDKLDDLINGERWGFHSGPIGIPKAESCATLKRWKHFTKFRQGLHLVDWYVP